MGEGRGGEKLELRWGWEGKVEERDEMKRVWEERGEGCEAMTNEVVRI